MRKFALTIASSDPSGGAGIEADLKVFSAHRVSGLTAITAITLQDSRAVRDTWPVDAEVFRRVLEVLRYDHPIAAIKIGALATLAHVEATADFLAGFDPRPPVVLDPVFRASSGAWLLEQRAVPKFADLLFPYATLVTPNAREAEILTKNGVATRETMNDAAEALCFLGAEATLVKGGHVPNDSHDVLCYRGKITDWKNDLIPHEFHGTGCVLSSAITARLAQGAELTEAGTMARQYLRVAMSRATPGRGEAYVLDFPPARK